MNAIKLSFGASTPYRAHTVATAYGVPTQPTEDGLGQGWVYLFTNQDLLDVEKEHQLELVETIVHRFNSFSALLASAKEVMTKLEEHGGSVVPHLLDTDMNAGQRLRDAIAAAEAQP